MESSTSITVRWGPVECRHRNGEITGYYVRYGKTTELGHRKFQKCLYQKYPCVYGPIQSISQVGEAKVKHLNMPLGNIQCPISPLLRTNVSLERGVDLTECHVESLHERAHEAKHLVPGRLLPHKPRVLQ